MARSKPQSCGRSPRSRLIRPSDDRSPTSQRQGRDYNENTSCHRSSIVTQEFQVSVTPVGVDEYLVRTERVEPGVPLAEEQAVWPVDRWLVQSRHLMNDPLSGLLQEKSGFPKPAADTDRDLVTLGQHLYNALFQGSLRDSWMMAQGIAHNRQEPIRLRLGLKGTRLPSLPWEVLHDGDYPLATGTNVLFSRYQPSTNGMAALAVTPQLPPDRPLRVLMAVAAPGDRDSLQLTREAEDLKVELNRWLDKGYSAFPTEVEILEQPSRSQLTQALEHGHYQILHYAGHSNSGSAGGSVYLVNQTTGLTETLSGDDLAGLLANNGIQMVVFNSCRGAHVRETGERNLAAALVKRGIPAVLAMAERIPDEVALTLTRLFYRNLTRGCPIDLSVSRARQGLISAYGSNQLYWALPIFYLHPQFDGYLTSAPPLETPSIEETLPTEGLVRVETDTPSLRNAKDEENPLTSLAGMAKPLSDTDRLEDTLDEIEYGDMGDMADDLDAAEVVGEIFDELSRSRVGDETLKLDRSPQKDLDALSHADSFHRSSPTSDAIATDDADSIFDRLTVSGAPEQPSPVAKRFPLLPVAGALAVGLAVGVGWWVAHRSPADTPLVRGDVPIVIVPEATRPPDTLAAWREMSTDDLAGLALVRFQEGDIEAGVEAVAILLDLDRNALGAAKAALDSVPKDRLDDPEILFLKGRLAWQFVQVGNDDYSIDDAIRYWREALRVDPESLLYRTALGFAEYEDGNPDAAYQTWLAVIQQVDDGQIANATLGNFSSDSLTLNAYAGLTLTMFWALDKTASDKRDDLLYKTVQLRQLVLDRGGMSFQPNALSQNWLWTPTAIRDWNRVLGLEASSSP